MAKGNQVQQLIDSGVGEKESDFSNEARQLINSLSDEELACYLSVRTKIVKDGSPQAQSELDRYTLLFF